jgi:transposase
VWSVLRAPTVQEEDARRVERELQRLTGERTAHINRIGSLLVLHNLRTGRIGGRDWAHWWKSEEPRRSGSSCCSRPTDRTASSPTEAASA